MAPQLVIVQSKKNYDKEQSEKARLFFKIVWWIFCSFLFSSVFKAFASNETLGFIFFGFIILFAVADLTTNRQLRSYMRAIIAFLYGFWGLAFIIIGIIMSKNDSKLLLISLIVGGLFLWLCYKNLKKYTRLINKIFKK